MKALILKLLTEDLSPTEVAARLREMADAIERDGLVESDVEEDGKLLGTVRVATRKPAMRALNAQVKPKRQKSAPAGQRRCDLGRAIRLANDLEHELRLGGNGAEGIVLGDLIEPAARMRQRLELLRVVNLDKGINHGR